MPTSIVDNTDKEEEEKDEHSLYSDCKEVNADEIIRVTYSLNEEVIAIAVVDDGQVACDLCGLRFVSRDLNRHKAFHKKEQLKTMV